MAQIRDIKKRMTAVSTIQRITKTMQMIATAKFTSSLQRARATRPYTDKIRELVAQLAANSAEELDDPLIGGVAGAPEKELILVVSSDRGLCGAYNSHVLRLASGHLRALGAAGTDFELQIVGRKAGGYFSFTRTPVAEQYSFGDKPEFDQVAEVASTFIHRFAAGEFSAVRVAYMKFISSSRQEPELMQLLPMRLDEVAEGDDSGGKEQEVHASSGGPISYEFSPSVEEILAELLPRAVRTSLFQAINDAIVSEQVMRMVAMKAATDNATSLGRTLKRDFNRARQGRITTELTEIVSGAAALE